MYNEKIEELIKAALADGVLTEKEKQVLFKKAQAEGIDLDEFEMVLDARLVELQKAEKTTLSAPKSTKYGDDRKCPACGQRVPALAVVCPYCGFEFSGVDANLTSKEFATRIEEVEAKIKEMKEEKEKDVDWFWAVYIVTAVIPIMKQIKIMKEENNMRLAVIQNFPIPTTKADLFEFIVCLQNKSSNKIYRTKLSECIMKAETLFPNDSQLQKVIVPAKENIEKQKKMKLVLFLSLILLSIIISGLIVWLHYTNTEEYCEKKAIEYVDKGNLEKAAEYTRKNATSVSVNHLVAAYVEKGELDKAIEIHSYWRTEKSENLIINELIKQRRFEEAINYGDNCEYGTRMLSVVKFLCEEGKKNEARKFIKLYSNGISQYNDGTTCDKLVRFGKDHPSDVIRILNDFVNKY